MSSQVTRFFFMLLVSAVSIVPCWAKEEDRVAIVMGNGNYLHSSSLPNPPNDARKISRALEGLGFKTKLLIDASKEDLALLRKDIRRLFRGADVGLFFYAGHGMQVNGENFIVPVDASFEQSANLSTELVSMTDLLSRMEKYTSTNLIFLDACRNNPLADVIQEQMIAGRSMTIDGQRKVRNVGQGLAEMNASVGTLIAYATQPGNVAEDGQGVNSPFTRGILRHINKPGAEIREILTSVRVSVLEETDQRQIPWDHSSLTQEFYFIPPVKPKDVPLPPP